MATEERRNELKVREANDIYRNAEKYTQKTLTRWKPDWDSAAQGFEKASLAYKQGKDIDRAVESSRRASECWAKIDNLFLAGRNMENAGNILREKDPKASVQLLQKASQLFQENGQNEKAAEMLGKAAATTAEKDPQAAVTLYQEGITLYVEAGKEIFANELFKKCLTTMVRADLFHEAIDLLKKHAVILEKLNSQAYIWKNYLSVIVLRLHLNESDAAEREFQEFSGTIGFSGSDEWFTANNLLDAWEKGDEEKVEELSKKQIFTFLDNGIARIAKKLRAPQGKEASIL